MSFARLLQIYVALATVDFIVLFMTTRGPITLPIKQLSSCRVQLGNGEVVNLEPLARTDGYPRFVAVFNFSDQPWNYSFNPCQDYDVPYANPHVGFGDKCLSVSICKYAEQHDKRFSYTLGIHTSGFFHVSVDDKNSTTLFLIYPGIKSMRSRNTTIRLVCDRRRKGLNDGLFTIIHDNGRGTVIADLRHECCCPGGCVNAGLAMGNATGTVSVRNSMQSTDGDEGTLLVIVGSSAAILMMVALVGGLCFIKRTHGQIYSKLPALSHNGNSSKPVDFRDYEPTNVTRKKLMPILEDTMIPLSCLEMGQRLGGGIFGDTHLAKYNEMTVAVKRLTLLVHENQITPEAMKLMQNEVWFLSRQRHKNIVATFGLCLDSKLPLIITEYVIGECLKDFLKVQGAMLSWPHRIKVCIQVADGMAFLHSTKPPIVHRDLRCSNLFLADNDMVKVADFGLTKLLQPIREECPVNDCCCRRTMSACPASIRWTAPELLADPCAKEGVITDKDTSVITTACDVFSFAMVMWELPMVMDPFEEISTESEVVEIVKNGGRPETPASVDIMPHYKDLMKQCWDQEPGQRPSFKQVATRLKDLAPQARAYQKQLNNRQRLQKLQEENMV